MSDDRQTVAGAYQRIDAHEDLCAERYGRINDTLAELKSSAKQHERAAWGIVLALLAWMGVQLYNDHSKTPTVPAQPAAVAGR